MPDVRSNGIDIRYDGSVINLTVADWQIDVSTDSRLDLHEDAFGNVTHVLTHGSLDELTISVDGLSLEAGDAVAHLRHALLQHPGLGPIDAEPGAERRASRRQRDT